MIIPEKNNPILPLTISVKEIKSIVNWFEHHQRSFYALGWSYLGNQGKIEELFYRAILQVHKELPKFKNSTSFEMWVLSIFIQVCRELPIDNSLKASEESIFHALQQLKEQEREVLVLTYIKGVSREEAAQLLQLSSEQINELLFSGFQLLRKGLGNGECYQGCKEYQKLYMDYLERKLERPRKIDFEMHIYHCHNCQDDLASLQETILNFSETIETFSVPAGFMENVKERVTHRENFIKLKKKKSKRIGFISASVFVLFMCTGYFTGIFSKIYYSLTEENQELRIFLQEDLGEKLGLEAESNGVKIKIKSVIADEIQTLIFYEIEDTNDNNQYMINIDDGIFIEDEMKIMVANTYPMYIPPDMESDLNKKEKNIYHGKMSLRPLKENKATIQLNINKVLKLKRNSSDSYVNMEPEEGDWKFDIPVTKKTSVEYALDEEVEIEGTAVLIDKLILAPTGTILQYGLKNEQPEKRIEMINFKNLEINNKVAEPDLYGNSYVHAQNDLRWSKFQAQFKPLFEKETDEVKVRFDSVYMSIVDNKTIALDASREYPQTFEYAGSTISIEKVEMGQSATVVFSNHEIKNRAYESLHYNIVTEEGDDSSMEMDHEGIIF
ncbi:DUF4179 domain-containing protein [Cytobacillus firmus]|uniref:DUF4179 domain-containing protein n=1 Tax=Cytobacillus firmus TaxID=1399 RepID=UPI001CFEA627|nr:DUF4179 domain-containing protein [Cytobacillus firmus]